jgi:hypothetical protein
MSELIVGGVRVSLSRDELAALDLPGRGLFGPMSSEEIRMALAICKRIHKVADDAHKERLAPLMAALESVDGPHVGPDVMRGQLETILQSVSQIKAP